MKKHIVLLSAILLSGCWDTSSGTKTGMIVKVAYEGAFWRTWQGEMIRGGFDNGTGANGQAFDFNLGVFNNDIVKKALSALDGNHQVAVKYRCEMFVMPWAGEEKCTVYDITEIKHG